MLASSLSSNGGKNRPRLVTQPWRSVPVGTNGGVTLAGTLWSIVGGLLVGALMVAMDAMSGIAPLQVIPVTVYAGLCGLLGSLIDSILGATLQATHFDDDTKLVYHADNTDRPASAKYLCGVSLLNNAQVNLVSVAMTAGLGGWILAPWFFGLW